VLISPSIDFGQLIGSHIAEHLQKYILHEIKSLKICDKRCSITTDNASNVVSTTSNMNYFGTRISCLVHIVNLVVQDGVKLWDKKR